MPDADRTTYPIILAHGICRFDLLMNMAFDMDSGGDDRFHYFRGIRTFLESEGYTVYHSRVSWAAGVETRAAELRDELLRITQDFRRHPKVHIIAHSMGGLDARRMIFNERMHDRVASVATISTPHLGTSFADYGLSRLDRVIDIVGRWGLDLTGFRDLTRAACAEFNQAAEKFELSNGVRYRTYAGVADEDETFVPLRHSWRVINREEGPNDGLVSVESAKWREDLSGGTFEGDHRNEIGWADLDDLMSEHAFEAFESKVNAFYLRIARDITAESPPGAV
jgi:triacylglycerol lipase